MATAGLAAAAPSQASHGQLTYFEGATSCSNRPPGHRPSSAWRRWATCAAQSSCTGPRRPGRRTAPTASPPFDATSPALRLLQPLATPSWPKPTARLAGSVDDHRHRAPRWATSNHRRPTSHAPTLDFGEFVTAVGRNFAGEVSMYSIWKRPTTSAFLLPQWARRAARPPRRGSTGRSTRTPTKGSRRPGWRTQGPLRRNRADRLHHRQRQARRRPGTRGALAFLRSARAELEIQAGRLLQRAADERLGAPRLHAPRRPLTRSRSPTASRSGRSRDSNGALDKAAAAHAIPAHVPIYLTEFGVQSVPNQLGAPTAQAGRIRRHRRTDRLV